MRKKYGRAGQATEYYIVRHMRISFSIPKATNTRSEHVIRIDFSTSTMVSRTRLNITFICTLLSLGFAGHFTSRPMIKNSFTSWRVWRIEGLSFISFLFNACDGYCERITSTCNAAVASSQIHCGSLYFRVRNELRICILRRGYPGSTQIVVLF